MKIFCVACDKNIEAKLVSGSIVYPRSPQLAHDKFWMCNSCKNFIGCHKNANKNKLKPLGVIANKELKEARIQIHNIIDPIWQGEKMKRGEIYAIISNELGYTYHTGELRSLEEARMVWKIVAEIHNNCVESACV
jgi:zinc-finger-containing domain